MFLIWEVPLGTTGNDDFSFIPDGTLWRVLILTPALKCWAIHAPSLAGLKIAQLKRLGEINS